LKRLGLVNGWIARLGQQLLPACCVLCGGAGDEGLDLCRACHAGLPRNERCCARCALPLAASADACGVCVRRPPAFDAAFAPFRYDYPLDRLVQRLKFSADLAAGQVLGRLLAHQVDRAALDCEAIVPVPLSRARLRARGFNQALELARPLSRALGLACHPRWLARARETAQQTGLDARARRRNVRAAFVAQPAVAGRRIALLDDVATTGATARECARVLKRAGAARVVLLSVARAAA
jgi:ComF family protein